MIHTPEQNTTKVKLFRSQLKINKTSNSGAQMSSEYLVPYLVSNLISIVLLLLAIKWPRLTRTLFVFIFLAAGLFNIYTALTEPESYLSYQDTAVLEIYRSFIRGFFSKYTQEIVVAIALGQLCISVLLNRSRYLFRMGVIGGSIFLIAISPLGFGSAFPATLLMVAALLILYYHMYRNETIMYKSPKIKN